MKCDNCGSDMDDILDGIGLVTGPVRWCSECGALWAFHVFTIARARRSNDRELLRANEELRAVTECPENQSTFTGQASGTSGP